MIWNLVQWKIILVTKILQKKSWTHFSRFYFIFGNSFSLPHVKNISTCQFCRVCIFFFFHMMYCKRALIKFQWLIVRWQNAPWECIGSIWFVWLFWQPGQFLMIRVEALLHYIGLNVPLFTFSRRDFSPLQLLNY